MKKKIKETNADVTMYVKDGYRGKGYSKMLNDAILEEAKNRGFEKSFDE